MQNVPEKFLPIGTVVMLKGGTKRIMITGYCMIDKKSNNNKLFDYCGCLFPEGMVSSEQTGLFDHSQIEKVYYMGFQDEEQKKFIVAIKNLLATNPNLAKGISVDKNTTEKK